MKSSRVFIALILAPVMMGLLMYGSPGQVIAAEGEHAHDEKADAHGHDDHDGQAHDGHGDHEGHGDHGDEHGAEGVIRMSEESQKLASISVIAVADEAMTQKISLNGRMAQDVETVTHVHPQKAGKIMENVAALGSVVAPGDVLCRMATKDKEPADITAPVAGTVIAVFSNPGDPVGVTNALYTIADMTRLTATFDVYEKDVAHIQSGQQMKVYPAAYADRAFDAAIVFISPRVDASTHTTRIKAVVDNASSLLKLGMSVRGEIEVSDAASHLKVPADAVRNVDGRDIVFVQVDRDSFEKREVTVRSRTSTEAAITGNLNKGDRVVVGGAFILKSKLLESEMEHAHDH